jgi:hypothetical protein
MALERLTTLCFGSLEPHSSARIVLSSDFKVNLLYERGERDGRGKIRRGERDDRGEAMSKRCVLQGRQVHGGVSVGERTRAATLMYKRFT